MHCSGNLYFRLILLAEHWPLGSDVSISCDQKLLNSQCSAWFVANKLASFINQIYLVTFMCLKVDTSFIFTKKLTMAKKGFLISLMLKLQCCQKVDIDMYCFTVLCSKYRYVV